MLWKEHSHENLFVMNELSKFYIMQLDSLGTELEAKLQS